MRDKLIVDGSSGSEALAQFPRLPHATWPGLDVSTLARRGLYVLNCRGDELYQAASAMIRRKCGFVLPDYSCLDGALESAVRNAVSRRKIPVYVLGSGRSLPIISRLKEVVSGGTLGEIQIVEIRSGVSANAWAKKRLLDIAQWLVDNQTPVCETSDTENASVTVSGKAGTAEAVFSLETGEGTLTVSHGEFRRQTAFPACDALHVELQALADFDESPLTAQVSGLVQ